MLELQSQYTFCDLIQMVNHILLGEYPEPHLSKVSTNEGAVYEL